MDVSTHAIHEWQRFIPARVMTVSPRVFHPNLILTKYQKCPLGVLVLPGSMCTAERDTRVLHCSTCAQIGEQYTDAMTRRKQHYAMLLERPMDSAKDLNESGQKGLVEHGWV